MNVDSPTDGVDLNAATVEKFRKEGVRVLFHEYGLITHLIISYNEFVERGTLDLFTMVAFSPNSLLVRVLLERAYAVSRNWNNSPVILCGDFNSTPRSPLHNFIAEQKVSGQYAASNFTPRPYTSSGLYRPQPRVYKQSEGVSDSEQGRMNAGTDSTHQCEIGNASFPEIVPLSKRPTGEIHTDAHSPVSQCTAGKDTTSDAIANEKCETVVQDDKCSNSISAQNAFVPESMRIIEIFSKPSVSSLNTGNGGTEQSPSVSCSDAFEEVVVTNTAPAAAKEITPDKMSMRTFPDIVEVSSINGIPGSDLITEQEDHLVISYKETFESSQDNVLITSPSNTKSVDLRVNELNEITVKNSCPDIDDGNANSSRDIFRHVGGVVSLHDNGRPGYSAQSNSDINCQYQEKSIAYGVQNNQFDDPISPGQGDNKITDLCQSEENSDPNFFKELLGTEDAYGFREEAGVGMLNSASLLKSTSTAFGTLVKKESSSLIGPHYAGQEANSYTPYNPYLWTPVEIEAASGKADCPFIEHNLKLKSAYTDVEDSAGTKDSGRQPQVTSYNRQFMGTVDYIWLLNFQSSIQNYLKVLELHNHMEYCFIGLRELVKLCWQGKLLTILTVRLSGCLVLSLFRNILEKGLEWLRNFLLWLGIMPRLLFMDEIDSIGSASMESGTDDSEAQRTMLELLNQLDGF